MISELIYTSLLALTVSLFSSRVGFSKVAESIIAGYLSITGRKEYLKLSNELQQLKDQLSRLSAIDNFAQWAKLNRLIASKQKTFNEASSKYSFDKIKFELILSFLLRIVIYVGIITILLLLGKEQLVERGNQLAASSFANDPTEYLILRIVYGNGALSLFRWYMLCNIAYSVF